MIKKVSIAVSTLLLGSSLYGQTISVTNVWQLSGAIEDINTSSFDSKCVDYIWRYDATNTTNVWQLYIPNAAIVSPYVEPNFPTISTLKSGDGFWLKGNGTCSVDTNVTIADTNTTEINNTKILFNIGLLSTGQTKSYDLDGNEITDESIKDDGYYNKGLARSYTRDDNKEVVVDNTTGLMWQDNSDVADEDMTKPWVTQENYDAKDYNNTSGDTATTYCSTLTLGGFTDWRLPSQMELKSIVDISKSNPAMNPTFQNTVSSLYWSSTTIANYTDYNDYAWSVYFGVGYDNYSNKNDSLYVRCVRDN